ncbi:MAG TPA: transposase [Gammaproteobacteria bacterium]|nr:transposase [Gammaproteobacteria bacterium]
MRYRRSITAGGTYFFTADLADRQTDLLVRHVGVLRSVISKVKAMHPFTIGAMVVLPEHLHAIWRLPPGDSNYSLRWSLIKAGFSRLMAEGETSSSSRRTKRERVIWQRRYWEHQIRDDGDLARHVDYIHFNPVKHGWAHSPRLWPHSSIHRYIERGILPADWCANPDEETDRRGER